MLSVLAFAQHAAGGETGAIDSSDALPVIQLRESMVVVPMQEVPADTCTKSELCTGRLATICSSHAGHVRSSEDLTIWLVILVLLKASQSEQLGGPSTSFWTSVKALTRRCDLP